MTDKKALVPMGTSALAAPQATVDVLERALREALAVNTRRAYKEGWTQFVEWCRTAGAAPLPARPEAVALFLAHLAEKGRKVATLEARLAAIAAAHRAAKHDSPTRSELVHRTMQGLRRTLGVKQTRKAPVTLAILERLVATLGEGLPATRNKAMLLLGFAMASRRSELVALTAGDLEWVDEGLLVTLRRGKTDQAGEGRTVAVPYWKDEALCPARAVRRWVDEIRRRLVGLEILAEQPLFDLRPAAVGDLVKACCEKAKLDSAIYSGHSLRAGHVTEAFARGIDAATIMEVTGHTKIDMLLKYKREANKMKLGSAGRIGK